MTWSDQRGLARRRQFIGERRCLPLVRIGRIGDDQALGRRHIPLLDGVHRLMGNQQVAGAAAGAVLTCREENIAAHSERPRGQRTGQCV